MNALTVTAAQVSSESGPMTRPRVRLLAHHRSLDDRTRRGIYHERLADCPCGAPAYAGTDWYRIPAANRIVMRILDGADDRFGVLLTAFRDHDAALAESAAPPAEINVERLKVVLDQQWRLGLYGQPPGVSRKAAEAIAAAYGALASQDKA